MDSNTMPKGRLLGALVALFLSTCCTMGDMVIVPITSNLFEVFDNVMLVNAIISGPAILGILICIIAGPLADKINKKTLMIVGFAIFTVSSILGCAVENAYYILMCRLFATGVAWGLTSTVALSILAEWFQDEKKHGTMVGLYNAIMAGVGAALSMTAGILAVGGWQMAYRTYWISIPILVMLIIFLPSMPSMHHEKANGKKVKSERGWYKPLIPLIIEILLVATSYYVIVYVIAVYVTDTGIGNAAFIGTLASIGTIASAVSCFCFGTVYAKLKNAVAIPSCFIIGLCFLIMYFIKSAAVALICCAVMGVAWGLFFSYFYAHCTELVPENMQGTTLGIIGAVNGLASFLCTYILTAITSIMGAESSVSAWPVLGILCIVAGIMAIIFLKYENKMLSTK